MNKKKVKRGPKSDNLRLEGDWEKAVKKAIGKKKPEGGWPEKEKKANS